MIWRWLAKPVGHGEQPMADHLLRWLDDQMLLLWDQGFHSYARVRAVVDRGANLLGRARPGLRFDPVQTLPDGSYLADVYPYPAARRHGTGAIRIRVIDHTLDDPARPGHGEPHRLLTTLTDPARHPAQDLVELYHARWEEEIAIDEVKTHQLQRPTLRSQTPAGVVQELAAVMIAHYVVRRLMLDAAVARGVEPTRISFQATIDLIQIRLPTCPAEPRAVGRWWAQLVAEVGEELLPPSRNRVNPRVIKRKMSKWPKKRRRHFNYPQPKKKFRDSIVVGR